MQLNRTTMGMLLFLAPLLVLFLWILLKPNPPISAPALSPIPDFSADPLRTPFSPSLAPIDYRGFIYE